VPSPLPCSFFLSRSRHHRDLHSFPTRRSSDLELPELLDGDEPRAHPVAGVAAGADQPGVALAGLEHRVGRPGLRVVVQRDLDVRSEEHTSELQSLAYLVCRLLLEKKKKKKIIQ